MTPLTSRVSRPAAVAAAALVLAVCTVASPASAQGQVSSRGSCPALGCGAQLIPLDQGGYVLLGTVRLAAGSAKLEPRAAHLYDAQGRLLQSIALKYTTISYICCCPTEVVASIAAVVQAGLAPGEPVLLSVGDPGQAACIRKLVVPDDGPFLVDLGGLGGGDGDRPEVVTDEADGRHEGGAGQSGAGEAVDTTSAKVTLGDDQAHAGRQRLYFRRSGAVASDK